MSNGPVAKLKVTGVSAAPSPQRENAEPAIIVSYDDHARAFIYSPLRPLFMMKMHQRTLCVRCILRVSMTRRYFISKSPRNRGSLPPPPSLTNPLPSNLSPGKLEAMRAASFTDARFCHRWIEVFPFDVAESRFTILAELRDKSQNTYRYICIYIFFFS